MTNPFQHGSSGFPDSGSPSGTPGQAGRRFSSYASVASAGAAPTGSAHTFSQLTRGPGAFSHLLNPANDFLSDSPPNLGTGRGGDMDGERHGTSQNGSAWAARNPPLPSFSRAFDLFMGGSGGEDTSPASNNGFFVPSYLEGSTYIQRLEEAHQSKMAAQREAQQAGLPTSTSTSSLHSKPPSHRGMAYDVVEKLTGFEEDEAVLPLPTRWNRDDKWGGLEVLADGLEVKYTSPRGQSDREHEACSIRADHSMPPQCGMYYFEVTILSGRRDDTTIGIGFSGKNVALSRPPGWEPDSWGYHGDDGNCFASHNVGKHYGPPFTTGDTIGCGVNFRTGCAFFTKNGLNLGTAFREVKGKLYPSIGLKKTGEHIRVNFGQTPFMFDINRMMEDERDRIQKEIAETNTSKLAPGLGETALVQALVLQFLQHDGYVETAKAFAEEILEEKQALSLDPNEPIAGINIKDDDDANNRQRIRRAILEGDIDKALKHTNAYYPQVLKDNEQVFFRLRCRKFIEMVRKAAEMKISGRSNGHLSVALGAQEMDLDTNGHENGNGAWDRMETEMAAVEDLELRTMAYGQMLQAEYANDPRREVSKALEDIYSLMAYVDPFSAPTSHLLDRKGRVAVAEELNSAILSSLGRSSRAALETVYSQTSALLESLREEGGPGAFISLKDIIDDIPKSQPF